MRIIVFDIEISIPVEEVAGGWEAARRGECGVSAVVLWDSETDRYHIYGEENLEACIEHINCADLIVTFNGKNFDVPALEGFTGERIEVEHHYDILAEIWTALDAKRHKGWGLGKVAFRTIGKMKTDTGEHAPTLAREGRWATLFDYCLNDVALTKDLFEHIQQFGYVNDPDDMPLPLPSIEEID